MLTYFRTAAFCPLALLSPDSALLGGSVRFRGSAVTRSDANSLKINDIQRRNSMRTSLLITLATSDRAKAGLSPPMATISQLVGETS